ncbi:MarR family winged helix-turn-helix transcriptional regulator [Bordetella sp. N]|uniref:MarR family winged helix-turn-helix transcriptional regulator n=1 Tax=Bordetella sp. N TaxID=1746199 RepID=UPI000710E078|nr:MarR family transcriptional regulator [Bordetella sp. N]ALM84007.1 MarR family transcriptional regulator [Bordetella sp. N]
MFDIETGNHADRATEIVMPRGNGEAQQGLLDDMALMLGRQFSVYTAVCQAALAEQLGMPLSDLRALELVIEFDALPTGQLAQLLGVSSGGATALINRLEETGYVKRDRHPLDRRVIVIRPVTSRCAPLTRQRRLIADEIMLQARRHDDEHLQVMHGFLAQCVRALRHETLAWLETQKNPTLND